MSETSIQAAPSKPLTTAVPSAAPPRVPPTWLRPLKKIGEALASLRLTVFLFVLAMFLVFSGTLAMRDYGLWVTLSSYFRCWWAWIPLQTFVPFGQVFLGLPQTLRVSGAIPFPGGWLIGAALLINLLAAHIVRFKIVTLKRSVPASLELSGPARAAHFLRHRVDWYQTLGKRSGILLIHSGLVVMMLGEFITGKFATEALMPIVIGESANYLQRTDRVELAFLQDDPDNPGRDRVLLVPDALIRKGGTIDDPRLPFKIEIIDFMPNADVRNRRPDESTPATMGIGVASVLDKLPESTGADSNQKTDAPGAYVKFSDKDGHEVGTYLLWTQLLHEQEIGSGRDGYRVALRYERLYQPYKIYLEEFHHDVYPGTEIPKNFSSRVRVLPDEGASREVVVYMNNPLRYRGQTFYQSGTLPRDTGTILQVVHNPGADMPYVSCIMVCLGMLIHFGTHLLSFLGRRAVT
jgi:hypothetical protein